MSDSGLRDRRCAVADEHDPHEYRFGAWDTTNTIYYCHGGVATAPLPAWPKANLTSYYVTVMHSAPTGRMVDGTLSSTFVDLPGDPADKLVFDWMVGLIETGLGVRHVLPLWWVACPPA